MSLIGETILPTRRPPVWPCQIDHSALFDGVDDCLSRTPASVGDRRLWTYSTWVKPGNLGVQRCLLAAGTYTWSDWVFLNASGTLAVLGHRGSQTATYRVSAVPTLRDPSAYYNLGIVFDTTQATASERVRLYLNGSRMAITGTDSMYPLNAEGYVSSTVEHDLNRYTLGGPSLYWVGGHMAETHFVDGQALTPDAFGEFSDHVDGLWIPKVYTGTYGVNGFWLDFANAAALGADVSGNGNHWTVNNSPTQTLDTPTNNHCTLNPAHRWRTSTGTGVFSNGHNTITLPTAAQVAVHFGTFPLPASGQWYWEHTMHDAYATGGLSTEAATAARFEATSIYAPAGQSGLPTITAGDIMAVCFDADAETVQFKRNGADHGAPVDLSSVTPPLFPVAGDWRNSHATSSTMHFGATGFSYTPPEGFLPLSASGVPGGNVVLSGSYTGNGSADGPFVNTNCALETLTIGANAYNNDGTDNAVVLFFANGFRLVSATDNANAVPYTWSGTLKYPFKTSNAQTN